MVASSAGVTGDRAGSPLPAASSYVLEQYETYRRTWRGLRNARLSVFTFKQQIASFTSSNPIHPSQHGSQR